MYDAIIIGGGLVGAAAAYHLTRSGARTLLIDRHDTGRATDAGAGILAPQVSGKADAWWYFAVKAVSLYPGMIEALRSAGETDASYAVCGMLNVARDDVEEAELDAMWRDVTLRQQQHGIPGDDEFYEVSPREARELFPPLGENLVRRALYYTGGARVDGRKLSTALTRAAQKQGLIIQQTSADSLWMQGGTVKGVIVGDSALTADRVVIAGGAWSNKFGDQLGVQIPVEPQRGQIIHMRLPDQNTNDFPIVEGFHDHYLVSWEDQRVVAGASRETGSGFRPHTTVAGIQEVLGEATRVAPGLANAEVIEIRVGLRPFTRDGLPVLGTVPGVEGVYLATGHGPTGLQLGPYSGKLAADWALGRAAEFDVTPFRVDRFVRP